MRNRIRALARLSVTFICLALIPAAPAHAAQGSISLTVKSLGTAQSNAAVFTGVPFPPTALSSASQLSLLSGGQAVPRQTKVLSTYADGSIRVLLVGFRITLAAGETKTLEIRYNMGAGVDISPVMAWTRNQGVLALCDRRWYGQSGVFNLPFLASADNTLYPGFETRMRSQAKSTEDRELTSVSSDPAIRCYYDRVHALYMTMLRDGTQDFLPKRIWQEVNQYRELEILHSGSYKGEYNGGSVTSHSVPIAFSVVRRMYIQGLLEDYYFTGDQRSFDVAKEIADAYLRDAYNTTQAVRFTWTERIPGWEMIGLCAFYEATGQTAYLDAALHIANICMDHQDAMAIKYPNQAGIQGQTGAFVQDRNGRWFDPDESSVSGAGSPFMTTVLAQGLIRVYWNTGNQRVKQSLLQVADWLADAAWNPGTNAFWYICLDTRLGTTYALNPMKLQLLGFAHQLTGESKYRDIALRSLTTAWGNFPKEYQQAMQSAGQGLYLLQKEPGTVPMTLEDFANSQGAAAPTISSLNPSSATAGGSAFTLTVNGTGFQSGAVVKWGGVTRATSYVSDTRLTASISGADISTAGTASVTVANPDGKSSNPAVFTIDSPYTLTASPGAVDPSEPITVSWTAGADRASTDWVGLFETGTPDSSPIWWHYTFGTASGSFAVRAPKKAAQYEFRYFKRTGPTRMATSGAVTVRDAPGQYTVSASPSSVAPGGSVTVSWTSPTPTSNWDWIGLYRVGASNSQCLAWRYTKTRSTGQGSAVFTMPGVAGQYEFRYFLDNGWLQAAASNTVTVGP